MPKGWVKYSEVEMSFIATERLKHETAAPGAESSSVEMSFIATERLKLAYGYARPQ
jgi:hypothetical protein